ncbi:MAG TPA: flavin reductase family protein [Candidatus Limnocylindrales bacterium]|nr:flavin reductase family protein [Candidatus Limnocylindrales bacterium]
MDVKPVDLPYRDFYRILISSVAPRPIAWVSTLSADGRPNLAPFSFFNVVSGKPPLLGFSPALRRLENGHAPKDTLRNIRETGEFVVNIVTFEVAEAMNLTSGEYESSVNEFEIAKLTTRPSKIVRPPQVAESPVSFECKLHQILDFGAEPPSGSLVIGEIVSFHMSDKVLKDGALDPLSFDLIGRMGGNQYSRTTERFELERPRVQRKT